MNAFYEETPDIILSDMEMPVMNGKDFVVKAKENSAVSCIILTAYKDPQYLVDEADKTLFKPVALYELVSTIDRYFQTN